MYVHFETIQRHKMICFSLIVYFIITTQSYHGEAIQRECETEQGKCIFPFKYDGTSHTICTLDGTTERFKSWCYTSTVINKWGFCPETCFTPGVSNDVIKSCGQKEKGKKSTAEAHQFPWNALIGRVISSNTFLPTCSGAIISRKHILSVASCVDWHLTFTFHRIKIGNFYTKKIEDAQIHDIDKIVQHQDYDDSTYVNNIALVLSKTPFIYYDRSLSIKLVPPKHKLPKDQTMTFSTRYLLGYDTGGLGYGILQKKECSNQTKSTICTNSNGISRFDNGGGLLTYCKNGEECILVGLLSLEEGEEGELVFTKVRNYNKWLNDTIQNIGTIWQDQTQTDAGSFAYA